MLADFLIAAHALSKADRLVTRDRGFYRTHFSELSILDPSESSRSGPATRANREYPDRVAQHHQPNVWKNISGL